jgi:DNA-binding protein HU-beta
MNKTQLIDAVAKASNIKKSDTEEIINKFLETIEDEVAKGEKVQIMGFGYFSRKERDARTVKNPRTGEPIQVAASKSPSFSAGSAFKEKVNK